MFRVRSLAFLAAPAVAFGQFERHDAALPDPGTRAANDPGHHKTAQPHAHWIMKTTKVYQSNRHLARRVARYLFTGQDGKTVTVSRLVCEMKGGPKLGGAGWCERAVAQVIELHLNRSQQFK